MLVLGRKQGEGISIILEDGREIHVHVASIVGDKIRIGVDADRSIQIHRDEVWLEMKAKEVK